MAVSILLTVLFAVGTSRVTRADEPTPEALPPGTNLGLGALVYQADFKDTKAWPDVSVLTSQMTNHADSYSATASGPVR